MRPPFVFTLMALFLLGSGAGEPCLCIGPARESFQGRLKRRSARLGALMVYRTHAWLVGAVLDMLSGQCSGEAEAHSGGQEAAPLAETEPNTQFSIVHAQLADGCDASDFYLALLATVRGCSETQSASNGYQTMAVVAYMTSGTSVDPTMALPVLDFYADTSRTTNVELLLGPADTSRNTNVELLPGPVFSALVAVSRTTNVEELPQQAFLAMADTRARRRSSGASDSKVQLSRRPRAPIDVDSTPVRLTRDQSILPKRQSGASVLGAYVSRSLRATIEVNSLLVCLMRAMRTLMVLCIFMMLVVPAHAEASATNTETTPIHQPEVPAPIGLHRWVLSAVNSHRGALGLIICGASLSALLCHMLPAAGGVQRMPPSWDPAMQHRYSFRSWTQDLLIWSIATEMDPARKAALVVMSLRGTAQEYARAIPPQALIQGGHINGVAVDALTFLMHALAERFAALGDELRLTSLTDMFGFERSSPFEKIDELLTRFDITRQRAQEYGQLVISVPGLAWLLLKSCNVSDAQLLQVLTPFGGNFPQTEAELNVLKTQLRRMGHVLEGSPGNVAQALKPQRTQHASYWTREGDDNQGWPHQEDHGQQWGGGTTFGASSHAWLASGETTESDGGTDTDTCSSFGGDVQIPEGEDGEPEAERLFWAYQRAKSMWRRYTGKPTRAVRRFGRRFLRRKGDSKGFKGKGKGRPNISAFLASLDDAEVEQVYKGMRKGKGKGKGKRSSGKGKGRRQNPRGKDGQVLRCFRCGSDTHLSRECHRSPA